MDYGPVVIKPFQSFPHRGITSPSIEAGQPQVKLKSRPNLSLACTKLGVSLPASPLSTCSTFPAFTLLSTQQASKPPDCPWLSKMLSVNRLLLVRPCPTPTNTYWALIMGQTKCDMEERLVYEKHAPEPWWEDLDNSLNNTSCIFYCGQDRELGTWRR